jgi:hypothetical protein
VEKEKRWRSGAVNELASASSAKIYIGTHAWGREVGGEAWPDEHSNGDAGTQVLFRSKRRILGSAREEVRGGAGRLIFSAGSEGSW